MATIKAALPIFSVYSSSSSKIFPKQFASIKLNISGSVPNIFPNIALSPLPLFVNQPARNTTCELCSALQEVVVEENPEQTLEPNPKRKLYVVNLPWSLSVADIKELFGQCGTVKDVEVLNLLSFECKLGS